MEQMEIFKNQEFGSIHTFEQDGKVLFCGKDFSKLGDTSYRLLMVLIDSVFIICMCNIFLYQSVGFCLTDLQIFCHLSTAFT